MILDTDAVSPLLKGDPGLEALLARDLRHELPVIVIGEYRYALALANSPNLPLLDQLVRESNVLSVGVVTATAYATVRG